MYQQAVTEGVSVFVSSGDQGAAVTDYGQSYASHGINVNSFASTPYNVAVGGTDFSDYYSGTGATYWNATNSPTYASAKSYVPEIPWNNSCASVLLATYHSALPTYGSAGYCNAGDFSKTTTCGSTLASNASCTVTVRFKPTATGARSASLLFSDNGGGSPQAVSISGTGI